MFFWLARIARSRTMRMSPCRVAAISPRLAPGVNMMRSMRARIALAASSLLRVLERFSKACHLATAGAGDVRVNVRDLHWGA